MMANYSIDKLENAAKTLAGLLVKRSDIVLNEGSLALSQFKLEDGDIPTIMQREFKKNGVELEDFNLMLDQSKKISGKVS